MTQALQKQTTQHLTLHFSAITKLPEWDNLATEQDVRTALIKIQESKGKWYSEVMVKFWGVEKVPKKTAAFLSELTALFMRLKIDRDDLTAVTRRVAQTEFTGTTYQPLPDIALLAKAIKEVQSETGTKRMSGPTILTLPDIDMTPYAGKDMDELFEMAYAKLGGR